MVPLLPAWLARSTDAFRRLAEQPLTLLLLLLAINALARPYMNCTHDARLYSLQVMNQAEQGAFGHDVFLCYGSQDQYSVFSRIVGPLALALGVRTVFFGLYLAFNTLFIVGLFRLIRALFTDPIISTSALIFLVSAELFYGGHGIFTVHEQFFTPRLVATSLVLFALERILAHRFATAFILLAIAMVMHPLMAFGGVLIWMGCLGSRYLPSKLFFGSLASACLLGMLVLALPSLAFRLFGQMDEDWHDMVRFAVLYNYPEAWTPFDWLNHALALGLGVAGFLWLYRDDPVRARFLFIVTFVAGIGLMATTIASLSPYALLFQGQPYRAVWILKILQIPLGFFVLIRLSQSSAVWARPIALFLIAFFVLVSFAVNEVIIVAFILPVAAFYWRVIEEPRLPDWWWRAGIYSLLLGAGGWMLYRWGFMAAHRDILLGYCDQNELVAVFLQCIPAAAWLLAVFYVIRWFQSSSEQIALRWGCLAIALAAPALSFGLDVSTQGRSQFTRYGADVIFARNVIDHPSGRRAPTVYSSLGHAEYVWIDFRAASYFDGVQTAGVMFNRQTAIELNRRIELVNKFEMERLRKEARFMTDGAKGIIERLYRLKLEGPPPTRDDLVRLCQESDLDYVVIPQEFPGLYSAGNGRIFVYECNKVRNTSSFSARVAPRGN